MAGFQMVGQEAPVDPLTGVLDGFEEEEQTRSPNDPGISMDEFRVLIRESIQDAVDYAEETLAPVRLEEQKYFDGKVLPGDENLDATRSKAISRDVQDTIKAIMPSLLRVFFGGKSVVEFDPTGPEDEDGAKQATEYVNSIVLRKDNAAFTLFYDAFHDALAKGLGPVMWWWDESFEVLGQSYKGLTEQEYALLMQDPRVVKADAEMYLEPDLQMNLYDCHVTYHVKKGGKIRLEAVPPEERLINRGARNIDMSTFYGRRRKMTVSQVVAMGFDYDQVVDMGGAEDLDTNAEQISRDGDSFNSITDTSVDPSLREIEYVDGYIRADLDGDGFAELYHIACGGEQSELLMYANGGGEAVEMVNDIPYTEFCPDPVPHQATGKSESAAVMDIQRIKSNLLRATLDSLGRAIFPREEVVQNQVNMDDVLSPEIGAVIRVKAPGMIREVVTPFMGKEAIPIIGYMDEVKKSRTGINDATQGLDPKALQSTAQVGIEAAVSASKMQIEMIARLLANNGMTRLFKGVLRMVKTHQDKVRTVKLRNSWVPIDPSLWNADMDATVNTALGLGTDTDRVATLMAIAAKQELIFTTMGLTNPLVTVAEYRHTLAQITEIAGYPNPDKFFLPVEAQQAMQQMMQDSQQKDQQLQELQQQVMGLNFELQKHTAAEDEDKRGAAFQKRTAGIKNLVEAAQTAQEVEVGPAAMADEANAVGSYLQ